MFTIQKINNVTFIEVTQCKNLDRSVTEKLKNKIFYFIEEQQHDIILDLNKCSNITLDALHQLRFIKSITQKFKVNFMLLNIEYNSGNISNSLKKLDVKFIGKEQIEYSRLSNPVTN